MKGYEPIPEKGPIGLVYAAIGVDGENEGVVGIHTDEGWMPMVVTNREDLDVMLGQCQALADQTGHPVRVVKFERAGLVGEFRPGQGTMSCA